MQTPRTDAALEAAQYQPDEAMQRIFSVMTNKNCRDSFKDLAEMPFEDFYQLEMMFRVRAMFDEEIEFNKSQFVKQ